MYDERALARAAGYGIDAQLQALDDELTRVHDVVHVEYDIRDWPEIPYVILVIKYAIRADRPDYFEARATQRREISAVCSAHDLFPTGDTWEDMGEHWYVVRRAGQSWIRNYSKTR